MPTPFAANRRPTLILAVMLCSCVVALSIQARRRSGESLAEGVVLDATAVGLRGLNALRSWGLDVLEHGRARTALLAENRALRERVVSLEAELLKLRDSERERQRLLLLLDGLNEMPHHDDADYHARLGEWKRCLHAELCAHTGNRVVFSCRSLDYSAPLSTPALRVAQVLVTPMNDAQVRAFLAAYSPSLAVAVSKPASLRTRFTKRQVASSSSTTRTRRRRGVGSPASRPANSRMKSKTVEWLTITRVCSPTRQSARE